MAKIFYSSTAMRLSMRYAALYALLTAAVLLAAYLFAHSELREWIDDDVKVARSELEAVYNDFGREALIAEINNRASFTKRGNMIYAFTDEDGKLIAGNVTNFEAGKKQTIVQLSQIQVASPLNKDVTAFIARSRNLDGARLVIGKSTHLYHETSGILMEVMSAGLALLIVVGFSLGVFVSRKTERRIVLIGDTLTAAANGNFVARIPLSKTDDDLSRVSRSINDMLGRVGALIIAHKQVSTDIAHDLKTPIQRLRQKLESIRSTDEENTAVVAKCVAEVDEIIGIFQALLRIAQIEMGSRRERFMSRDLRDVLEPVASALEAVAEDVGSTLIYLPSREPIMVQGDRELLMQMAVNLIENAIRHSPAGSKIEMTLREAGGQAIFQVSDTGPGIPMEQRDKVFRRLYRLEQSRTTDGNGLGLSLVKAITKLHDATISLSDNCPGLTVMVTFPVGRA